MERWKKFELDATDYLNDTFSSKATFVRQGGSDSNISDIAVTAKTGEIYYIEAKLCPAQCGQFVVLPNIRTNKFDYSPLNFNKLNIYSEQIIDVMNNNFEVYKNAGTTGEHISFENSQEVFANWIITTFKEKKVRFIITNGFNIADINDLGTNFKISAKYRIKRSGSREVGKLVFSKVKSYVITHYSISNIRQDGNKLFISSDKNLQNSRFYIDDNEYMISKRDTEYEIRKLSNTFHANVIFSIDLKDAAEFISSECFERMI